MENRFGYLSLENILLDGIKRRRQKSKNNTVRLHHTFCYISLPSLHDCDVRFSFFWLFLKNANKQKIRARATLEAKRVARITFLAGSDFTRSLKVRTPRLLQCTLASHADVRSLIMHSSRSRERNARRNPRTKNVRVGSYSLSKGAFQKSELTGRTIAGPVISTMKNAFFQEFLLKHYLLRACYLGFDWSGWIVLIKSEILIMTGMVWPVSSDKWKAP